MNLWTKNLEREAAKLLGEPVLASCIVSAHKAASALVKKGYAYVLVDQALGLAFDLTLGSEIPDDLKDAIRDGTETATGIDSVKDKLSDAVLSQEEKAALARRVNGMALVVSPTKFAIVETKPNAFGYDLGPLIVHVPKQEVVLFEFGEGSLFTTVGVTIHLSKGRIYLLETGRGVVGRCRKIAELVKQ
jgi:hypothetical protein